MTTDITSGKVLDNDNDISLAELCRACQVDAEWLLCLVEEGIIDPQPGREKHLRFSGQCLSRVRTVKHLEHDLGVNLAGAALALDLLEEVRQLRHRIRRFEQLMQDEIEQEMNR